MLAEIEHTLRRYNSSLNDNVVISTSTDADLETGLYPFERVVFPSDSERFIHVPVSSGQNMIEASSLPCSLKDTGINVSTGPVVDFRVKK